MREYLSDASLPRCFVLADTTVISRQFDESPPRSEVCHVFTDRDLVAFRAQFLWLGAGVR